MFVSTRDQGHRRRSHSHGISKSAWSSKVSLLSAITTSSSGSGGSTSTVTQESYNIHSSTEPSKRRKHRRRETVGDGSSRKHRHQNMDKGMIKPRDKVNVFSFLVQDAHEELPDPHPYHESLSPLPGSPVHRAFDFSTQSQHSDSGISMDDSTFDFRDVMSKLKLPSVEVLPRAPSPPPAWTWPEVPKPTPLSLPPLLHTYPAHYTTPFPAEINHHDASSSVKSFHSIPPSPRPYTKPETSGYELVASKLASCGQDSMPPIFKRFDKTNYRVLLTLQDEIAEMEEELAQLDMVDNSRRHNVDGSTTPASRRYSWQWNLSDLQPRRVYLLERLYTKVQQYYQALVLTRKIKKFDDELPAERIDEFRRWLKTNHPLSDSESHFLDDESDLLLLNSEHNHHSPAQFGRHSLTLCIVLSGVLPLLVFKVTFGFLNRLIILMSFAALATYTVDKTDGKEQRYIQQWIIGCTTLALFAALLV